MYILEGNIGAGKSTFLKMLAHALPSISISLEPINNWQKQVYGQSLLTNFYQNPNRWAYTLETFAMMSRVQEHIQEQKNTGCIIFERSVYSGHYCFAQNSNENGFMSELEWELYTHWFHFLIPGRCMAPQGFIFLQVDPQIAYERIRKRNRHAEKNLSLAYLKQIDKKHELFLLEKKNILHELIDVPVLILNCNEEFETDTVQFKNHVEQVQQFLSQTQRFKPAAPSQQPHQFA